MILVVEDDDDVREVSVDLLETLGYRVCAACDAKEALNALRRPDRIDPLFTDLVMPCGISGPALASQATTIRPGLRVPLTTGYAGLEARGTEFPIIVKPFRPAELGQAVAKIMGEPPPV